MIIYAQLWSYIEYKAVSDGVDPPWNFFNILFLTKYENLNSIKLQYSCFGPLPKKFLDTALEVVHFTPPRLWRRVILREKCFHATAGTVKRRYSRGQGRHKMVGQQLVQWRIPEGPEARPRTSRILRRRPSVVRRRMDQRYEERTRRDSLLRRPTGRRVELLRRLGGRTAARQRYGELARRYAVHRWLGARPAARPR